MEVWGWRWLPWSGGLVWDVKWVAVESEDVLMLIRNMIHCCNTRSVAYCVLFRHLWTFAGTHPIDKIPDISRHKLEVAARYVWCGYLLTGTLLSFWFWHQSGCLSKVLDGAWRPMHEWNQQFMIVDDKRIEEIIRHNRTSWNILKGLVVPFPAYPMPYASEAALVINTADTLGQERALSRRMACRPEAPSQAITS